MRFVFLLTVLACGGGSAPQGTVEGNVATMPADDAELKAAVAKARETLPEAVSAFEAPDFAGSFSVKVRMPMVVAGQAEEQIEHLWIQVGSVNGPAFQGVLANDSKLNPALKVGTMMTVQQPDIEDWLLAPEGGERQGGFTVEVLQKRAGK